VITLVTVVTMIAFVIMVASVPFLCGAACYDDDDIQGE
jgi:hypothetical protein